MQIAALIAAKPKALNITAKPPLPDAFLGDNKGMSIKTTTTARSCSSRIENVALP